MIHVLIPVNRLDLAKSRLAGLLSAEERRELAVRTLRNVVQASRNLGETTVLTADPAVREALLRARIMAEAPDVRGLNAQLEHAIEALGTPDELLILHADLPLATAPLLAKVAQPVRPPAATLVRSRDGGTNAMLLRPAGTFALAYGPDSFDKHMAAALGARVAVREVHEPSLALDLDTPEDIATFMSMEAGAEELRAYLAALELEARPAWPNG